MAVSDWLRPPRHLVVLFLGIALILMATLAWLGWRLFQQDRALEQQRVQVRLEHAADVVVAELTRRLGAIEDQLEHVAAAPPATLADSARRAEHISQYAAVLVLDDSDLTAYPSGRLPYYPVVRRPPEPDGRIFAEGEALEFRQRDLAGATTTYRRIALSGDSAIRAGALLRLARTERKAGHQTAALDAYEALRTLGRTPVGGLPAELVATHARLAVLDALHRTDELARRARELCVHLDEGRWLLTRAQYEFYTTGACRWIDCAQSRDSVAVAAKLALAAGAESLWNARHNHARDGRELAWADSRPVLIVWRRSDQRTAALVGGLANLASDWLGVLAPLLEQQRVTVAFADVNGNPLTKPISPERQLVVTRTVPDTRLPWTVHVASANPLADFAQLQERRRLMLLGLATLALFVAVGLYAVMRGVSRELKVARLQSDFVAAVSHEFRTPLTSLRQLAELLSSGRVASEQRRREYYGIMERESGRLHRLVEGLLDFGRMEAGALEFSWERVTTSDLVRSVVVEFEAERADSGYHVELTADGAVAPVRADPEALARAVWNLLDNAVKYSPDHHTVWVKVSETQDRVVIAVRDEGAGIPAHECEAIFEKFIRGSSSRSRGAKGTGIGLAMVKHIVEAHGGEVRVHSEVGVGSTFTILLPTAE